MILTIQNREVMIDDADWNNSFSVPHRLLFRTTTICPASRHWFLLKCTAGVHVVTNINHVLFPLARVITECPSNLYVDHINFETLDNRQENLRICTLQQNNQHRRAHGEIPFKGVTRRDGHFQARIAKDKKRFQLGCFKTAEDAAKAYDKAAKELHGEYAVLNFPEQA